MSHLHDRLCAALAGLALAVTACATTQAVPNSPPGALTVNGTPVAMHLYDTLVKTQKRLLERAGIRVVWTSTDGQRVLDRIDAQALKTLVRDAVVAQLASQRHISVSSANIDAAIANIEQVFGGAAVLNLQLDQEGLSMQDFQSLYEYRLLEEKMRQGDAGVYDRALQQAIDRAQVEAFVGPCSVDHRYPTCAATP